jgi:hypothetical protein
MTGAERKACLHYTYPGCVARKKLICKSGEKRAKEDVI